MAKKQKCPPCEQGAPLWMQTYSDMVTLLLAFFVLIYSVGQATPQEIQLILSAFRDNLGFFEGGQTLTKGPLEEMGMNVESLPSMTVGRSLSEARQQARNVFEPEIQARQVRVTEDERGLVISLIGADYFESGSAILTPAIEDVLVRAAALLRQLDRFSRIEGHTATGEDAYLVGGEAGRTERTYMNAYDLGSARAVNVTTFLQNQGVDPGLMHAASYGSYRPLALDGDTGTPEGDAHNRRIDIVILPYKEPARSETESRFRLPEMRIPGVESTIPDR